MPRRQPQYRTSVGGGLGKPLRQALVVTLAWGLLGPSGHAQVAPGGLGTRVNGTALGRCSQGVCSVQGGTPLGGTLFHRFSQFDTRGGIQRVDLDTAGNRNVVVGVSHPAGSFFNAPLRLSQAASLFWLSPGGIWLGGGGTILGATNLLLSTAPTLRLGAGEFKAAAGLRDGLSPLIDPANFSLQALPQGGLQGAELGAGDGPIVLAGGRLQVDRQLLLDSGAGPIRSLPGTRSALRAGGDVRLSGGDLLLRGLDVQAGSAVADGGVSLQAGALPGLSQGRLELADASLRGAQVELAGAGGLDLQRVQVHAGESAPSGAVRIQAGTLNSAAAARLNAVALAAGEVQLAARGPLTASDLKVEAGSQGGSGSVQLTAGPAGGEPFSLRLEGATLRGGSVVMQAQGASELRDVQASAARQGDKGGVWFQGGAGPAGQPGSVGMRNVELHGDTVGMRVSGDLRANDLRVQARSADLRAETPAGGDAAIRLGGGRLSGPLGSDQQPTLAERIIATASGDLSASALEVRGRSIQLQAGSLLTLSDGSQLRGGDDQSQIQLDALSPPGAPGRGRLELLSTQLEAQTITGRANTSVTLRDVGARAGQPGNRGVVRFESDPPASESPGGDSAAPRQGTLWLDNSLLAGQWVWLRSGAIALSGSRIEAPKGTIQLEAQQGDLRLRNSQLDVGVSHPRDLSREVDRRVDVGQTVQIVQLGAPPTIGLFAEGNINILEGSALLSSQDLDVIRKVYSGLNRDNIRLADTSGSILVDAGQALRIDASRLEANATDNLAGNIALRSRSGDAGEGLIVTNASISASGGAGSGDLRLSSNGGIAIENSTLQAGANQRMEDPNRAGQSSAFLGFNGGEITLTNASGQRAITIDNSQISAEQKLTSQVLSGVSLSGSGGDGPLPYFYDSYDDADNYYLYTGGIISILSNAGIQIQGSQTLISVGQAQNEAAGSQTAGGLLRLGNTSPNHGIEIAAGARLSAVTNPGAGAAAPGSEEAILGGPLLDARGRIHLWSQGTLDLSHALIDASTQSLQTYQSQPGTWSESISLRSASGIGITNTTLRIDDPEGISRLSKVCAVGCDGQDWNSAAHGQFLLDGFWGTQSGRWIPSNLGFTEAEPATDHALVALMNLQKQPFQNNPDDWLILPGSPPLPVSALPSRSAPPVLAAAVTAVAQAPWPVAASVQPLDWPHPAPIAPTALRPTTTTLAGEAAMPAPSDAALTVSDSRTLSATDAAQVFQADQDKARQEALSQLSPAGGTARAWGVGSLQEEMRRAMARPSHRGSPSLRADGYQPAILQISLTPRPGQRNAQINQVLVPAVGELQGWQSQVDEAQLRRVVRRFQTQLSQAGDLGDRRAGAELAAVLLGPVIPELRRRGINALLLSLDRGLQGIPFPALPVGEGTLADQLALTVTPALALTNLASPAPEGPPRVLLAGTSSFSNGLAPLPMARRELEQLAQLIPDSLLLLDRGFSRQALLQATQRQAIGVLHIASHAEFRGANLTDARIYTSDGEISLQNLGQAMSAHRQGINLFVLNACRTAVGDEQRELGISGLALQAGARSALGNLWYVDDVATAAFSLQFHRYLQQGYRKDQALQKTQLQFRSGAIRVRSDTIVNAEDDVLVSNLTKAQRAQLDGVLQHPYYWAGALLSGAPW